MSDETVPSQQEFPCEQCGATLQFKPGADSLHCEYCGHDTPIEAEAEPIEEIDYRDMLGSLENEATMLEVHTAKCSSCGAESTYDPNVVADSCAFCGTPIVTAAQSTKTIQPRSLVPFKVERKEAETGFKEWIKKLWFAPNELKKKHRSNESIQGIYIPHWTYDTNTDTWYRGQRGTHYYVTVSYRDSEGKTKTRQERRTRWRSVSGRVRDDFNDVLVRASHSLPNKQADKLEPWALNTLVPYKADYLSGFKAETYQVNLEQGFDKAKVIMSPKIDNTIRRDIGGDEQRISSKTTNYHDITFKHILLPVWISSYRYKEKVYRFLVNAVTGEVQGERPWSYWKIAGVVLLVLAIAGGIYGYVQYQQQ
jgi:hypothetical protein